MTIMRMRRRRLSITYIRVRGDCIQCPFHNWKFSGETGRCTEVGQLMKIQISSKFHTCKVPYSKSTIPEQAKLETKTCIERNGSIEK